MPGPKLACGGNGQPACPPENAAGTYTLEDMHEHGHANYHKGLRDSAANVNEVLEDPGPAWGSGELARAIRKVLAE